MHRVHRRSIGASFLLAVACTAVQASGAACTDAALRSAELIIENPAPVRFPTDITRRASARLPGSAPFDVKVRRAARLAQGFNNQPRYEVAAYELQRLIFEHDHEVVPPTVLRSMRLDEFQAIDPGAQETFPGTGAALFIVQCWLPGAVAHPLDVDASRFAANLPYARAIGNLNVLTFLITHKDSNKGNVMLTNTGDVVRAWAIDNGVAFAAEESDLGAFWRKLHVAAIDPHVHARLRSLDRARLEQQLGVVAEFALVGGRWEPQPASANLAPTRGVRRQAERLQLGLTRTEIQAVHRRAVELLTRVERGRLALLPR